MLYLTQKIGQVTKPHPTFIFSHVAMTFSYPGISQAQFDTLI